MILKIKKYLLHLVVGSIEERKRKVNPGEEDLKEKITSKKDQLEIKS